MSDVIRLVIVTDSPERAGPAIFGMPTARLPSWVLVMTDWQKISKIEAGTPCVSIWFRIGGSLAEQVYRERRQAVKLDDDFGRHFDRVTAWLDNREAAEREALAAALADHTGGSDLASAAEADLPPTFEAAAPAVQTRKVSNQSKWS